MANITILSAIKSALAALIGVQSEENRQRDFSSDSSTPFILAGVIITIVFVVSLIGLATLVI